MKGAIVAAVVALMAVALVVQTGHAAVTCGEIDAALAPCTIWLTGSGEQSPPEACCAGVKKVKALAITTADKRAACSCVKAAAIHLEGLQDKTAQSLPVKCQVQLDIPISRTVDCDKITLGIRQWVE